MNFYPDQLKVIVAYIEALNAVEKNTPTDAPYVKEAVIVDNDNTVYGVLRDEIGGSWSFFPTQEAAT